MASLFREEALRFTLVLLVLPGFVALAGAGEKAPDPLFSFAIVADPHIAGRAANEVRLAEAVRWIETHRETRRIELVVVVGDVAWGRGKIERARRILEKLTVPWVPVIGDNEVASGHEARFAKVFAPNDARQAKRLEIWRKAPAPVRATEKGKPVWLRNLAFTHRGVRFVVLDWVTRSGAESADLHDFAGGTLPFLEDELKREAKGPRERIVLLTHQPMHVNPLHEIFTPSEQKRLDTLLAPHAEHVYGNFAGHYHMTLSGLSIQGRYPWFTTDATFDDDNALRVVTVRREDGGFRYEHDIVRVPPTEPPKPKTR